MKQMRVWHPDEPAPTAEEERDFERLRAAIEAAIADGKLSQTEVEDIKSIAWADGKITRRELELYRTLISDKVAKGELEFEWS